MSDLTAALDHPPTHGRRTAAWVDATEYGRRHLLAGAAVPWSNPAELAGFMGKLQALVPSDAVLVDGGAVVAAALGGNPGLADTINGRSNAARALRTLLQDEGVRTMLVTAVQTIAAAQRDLPIVLVLPSPGRWLDVVAEQAGLSPMESPNSDLIETAAMYQADLLRALAPSGLAGLLLEDDRGSSAPTTDAPAWQPVVNVADHYRWPVIVKRGSPGDPDSIIWAGAIVGAAGRHGFAVGEDFWAGGGLPDAGPGDLLLLYVPFDADPDVVQQRLAALATN